MVLPMETVVARHAPRPAPCTPEIGVGPIPLRVLVVDDDIVVRDLLCRFMNAMGHQADTASNGSQALARFEHDDYDLVVTDVLMPGLDGWEVVRRFREKCPTVAVIVISGFITEARLFPRDPANTGRFVTLGKPARFEELKAAVARAMALAADCS